jgi:electron transfer flavoprotein alpha subunit
VEPRSHPCAPRSTQPIGTIAAAAAADTADLTEADTIIAAGNGIGSEANLDLLRELAELFPHGAVAGTRIVCDRGWLGYARQVGITGTTVTPALYIACGISGATQHRVGMHGSQFVVAINTDPGAPIFNEADLCIVEDLTTFIPRLLEIMGGVDAPPRVDGGGGRG